MRLALDARTIFRPVRRGTAKNLLDLYRHVLSLRPDWQVVAYHREAEPAQVLLPDNMVPRHIEMRGDRFDAWQRWRLPLAAWREGADLLHCPANTCPSWMPLPTIVTIHDLIPLDAPQGETPMQLRRFEQSIQAACRRASRIICPSNYTRSRLIEDFHADAARISVNAWAADTSVSPVPCADWQPVLDKFGVQLPFVLHFGATAPRKNTLRLLEAWAMLEASSRRNWQLLVVGLDDAIRNELTSRAARLQIESSVKLHGFADESDLPTLLSAAELLAYPSLSEGFGLPILDAWTVGTTVLCSDETSLPEVAGSAALYVDPRDTRSIASGLRLLLNDSVLRQDLARRGRERVTQFTWRATAERFISVVEQAAGRATSEVMAA